MVRRWAVVVVGVALFGAAVVRADVRQGNDFFKAGRYVEAAAEYQAIVEAKPSDHAGWFMLGLCLLRTERPEEAEGMFRRALALEASHPEYFHGLALALRARGRYAAAIDVLDLGERAASEPRARFALLSLRGNLEATLGRWPAAIGDLEAARAIKADVAVLESLGRAYLATGRVGQAIAVLSEALAAEPTHVAARRTMVEATLRAGASTADPARKKAVYGEALRLAEGIARERPDDLDAVNLVGRAALGAGRFDVAESGFRRVLEGAPRQCYAMVNLARVFLATSRWPDLEAMIQRAAACAPRLPDVHETRGAALLKQGRWMEAREAFLRARQLGGTPAADAGIAEAERQLGSNLHRAVAPPQPAR